jgi:hypothetical protein
MLALADLGTMLIERVDFAEGATAGVLDKAVGHSASAGVSIGTVVSLRGRRLFCATFGKARLGLMPDLAPGRERRRLALEEYSYDTTARS